MLYMAYSESKLIAKIWNDDIFVCEHYFFFSVWWLFFVVVVAGIVIIIIVAAVVHSFAVDFCVNQSVCVREERETNKRKFHANWMWEMFTARINTQRTNLSWIMLVLWPQIPINCSMVPIKARKKHVEIYLCVPTNNWSGLDVQISIRNVSRILSHLAVDSRVNAPVCAQKTSMTK